MDFLKDCSFSYYDKQKSDVFTLGAILLQAALKSNFCLYDPQPKTSRIYVLPGLLARLQDTDYSTGFV